MDNKYHYESQTINWSMAVLCTSFLLVYVVLYFAEWDLWKNNISVSNISTWDVEISQMDRPDINVYGDDSSYMMDSLSSWNMFDSSSDWDTWLLIELSPVEANTWADMKILSWTKTYYWALDFVEKLWISYKYALVDSKWIYYLNMWGYNYDFSDIARKLWWNLYIMNTEQELLANWMFGDKVTYINVPEYKNTKVLILLDIDDQSWLLAIDYPIYHQVKSYLKSLFITTS